MKVIGSPASDTEPIAEDDRDLAFRLLGPAELVGPDGTVRALSGRQLTVLAALLIRINHVVGVDHLIDAIWDEAPPQTARSQVQFCIHALRNELGRLNVPAEIVTHSTGYRLDAVEELLDSRRFERLAAGARADAEVGRLEAAAGRLRTALGLWRGPLLVGVPRVLRDQVGWLEELRTEVIEECIGHELDLGRHREAVGELRTLVAEHPLNEQFRFQLMLALYRSGRQGDALEVYRAGRAVMVEQLGLDPGEKLKRLEAAILADDRALLRVADAPEQARLARPATCPRPRQLPADIADFTGREAAITRLENLLAYRDVTGAERNAVSIVNLVGKAGVGKSALAVHVAHRVEADSFPDGQLYVNLGATRGQPVTAHDALRRFLVALGVSGPSIPDCEAERGEMYRSLLGDRKVLVVLDDATSEAQIRPLLPGSSSCAVVVTSRSRLACLAGAHVAHVDVLDTGCALALLAKQVGAARVERELTEAEALVESVGGLPLALRIVGSRLAARPHWTLRSMVERLADERQRLDELAHGELAVRGSLLRTYDALDSGAAVLLRRLGALDAQTLPGWTAAAVLDDRGRHAVDLVDHLVDAQLLDTVLGRAGPRYRFHDLVRIFAGERLRESDPDAGTGALSRVLGGWLALAEHAHRLLYGGDYTTLHGAAARWAVPTEHLDEVCRDPLRWMEDERANLRAAVAQAADAGLDELCWDLAMTMVSLFEVRGYHDDWLDTHENALRATRAAGNRRGSAAILCSLGSLHLSRGEVDSARSVLLPALEAFTELGDARGLALVHRNLGMLDRQTGAKNNALAHYRHALGGFAEVADVVGQGCALSQIAQLELDDGHHHEALTTLERAMVVCDAVSNPRIRSQIRYKVGKVLIAQGDYESANIVMSEVLELVRGSGDVEGESCTLHVMGVIQIHRGRLTRAAQLLEKAAALCEQGRDRVGAARVWLELARVERARGHAAHARTLAERSTAVFRECGMGQWADAAALVLGGDRCAFREVRVPNASRALDSA